MRLSNGVAFINRQEDLYNSEEFIAELEKYIEPSDELNGVILENSQLKAVSESTLWYGFKGLNVKLFLEEWRNKLAELQKYRKEKYTGKYIDGKTITISRVYGNYRFSDKECQDLFEGKFITISFDTQYGNTRTVSGKLEKKDWPENEIEFWGFITHDLDTQNSGYVEGLFGGQKIKFKNNFGGHTFTEDEIESLLKNEAIYIKIINKNGNKVAVRLKLIPQTDDFYQLSPDFAVPPIKWSGKEFSEEEIKRLHLGYSIVGTFISNSGNIYSQEIRWRDNKIERKTKEGWKSGKYKSTYGGYGNGDADSF